MSEWISTFPGYTSVVSRVKKVVGSIIRTGPTPRHVGVIMDGNRRYAKSHKIELKEGHNLGFDSMANILELLYESGVECATVYAFSIENFKRSRYEVEWLMDLARSKFQQISQQGELCEKYGIKIKILGNTDLLPSDVQRILAETENITKDNTRAVLNVCFPYTSRDEMTNSIKRIVTLSEKDSSVYIDESTIDDFLYTSESPPLDILVRTSGTYRLSDFLLWQSVPSSCAIMFSNKLWPDFTAWDMIKILLNWSFNMYWYGNGNGNINSSSVKLSTVPETPIKADIELSPSPGLSSSTTAYERFQDNSTESDSDSLVKSDAENNTSNSSMTSDVAK
ncbi:hypothetical protein FT663_00419 [Candidozyma haemuli var. vulneris]|nr:hypothetical protein FT662_05249 [[Candida] haemuloni var. vulneris]KAF3995528.1 hypothetical protein FT663_00419 [[Candida] haemuloni var. vulneris]